MITVHHLENSRSQRVLWLLEELQIPYEVKRYERDKKTGLGPRELYQIHPLGKSPVITDGDVTVAETGAIFEYIAEAHGAGPLMPQPGTPERRAVTYWLHYAEGSAMMPLLLKLVFTRLPENAPMLMKPVVRAVSKKTQDSFVDPRLKEHVGYWEGELARTGWFAGESFTLADIMMSFPLEAASQRAGAAEQPNIKHFLARIHARDAYKAALERGGPYAYA